ncbi:hypothetical protein G4B88_023916 [Cannabis sativa]|uniref:Retrotransposon gag domain-containing protein n=1 Tax=Cannabis sativa TaxID=3483 RepID=A0A7J6EVP4_CANSA|nr:hypothetical protein G4B88_023916 [Cannabis sativa]
MKVEVSGIKEFLHDSDTPPIRLTYSRRPKKQTGVSKWYQSSSSGKERMPKKPAKTDQEWAEELSEMEEVVDSEIGEVKAEVGSVRAEIGDFREEMRQLKELVGRLLGRQTEESGSVGNQERGVDYQTARTPEGMARMGQRLGHEKSMMPEREISGATFEHRRHVRLRRLELPTFEGVDPDGWVMRAEKHFALQRFNNEEMVEAATISFEGKALTWFRWETRRRPILLWEDLKLLLLNKFRNTSKGSLHEQFFEFRQSGTVDEYCEGFLELLAPLEGVSDAVALGQFLSGLKRGLKEELRLFEPSTLNKAMEMAAKIENKNQSLFGNRSPWGNSKYPSHHEDRKSTEFPPKDRKPMGQYRRMTDSELQEKRRKGICYRCDNKWSPGHRCEKKELSVIVTHDDEIDRDFLESQEISRTVQESKEDVTEVVGKKEKEESKGLATPMAPNTARQC